eukprot:723-Heterococcus_DN1.PRE.2
MRSTPAAGGAAVLYHDSGISSSNRRGRLFTLHRDILNIHTAFLFLYAAVVALHCFRPAVCLPVCWRRLQSAIKLSFALICTIDALDSAIP